ncbi:aspergillopepsin-2 precursor [Trichoderma arundinaceum]|uniref:Aspergillopepsin-2 n=1 Tax=Trichoderma arundinaceum TaxID=490622 RepID=A0A395NJL2_TRIAR|nr:aspergillopepsin-2 precursor [Trichoderma arundinaceum]
MKLITGITLSVLLCADAALAGVTADRGLARRLARRAGRRSAPLKNNTSHATVQSNWGGAILEGSGYTAASATVNVPAGGGGSNAAGSAWVGIDGATCDSAILQTGFDWYGDGTYDAWYEWYPEFAADFSGIDISEGDQIAMSVVATSLTSGSATLQNLSTGQKVTQTFSRVTAGSLCETSAEFIIEDFEECNSNGSNCQPVPFASFSPAVKFSSASATKNGKSVSLSGAVLSEVIVNNQDLTRCSISGSTLTCSYV